MCSKTTHPMSKNHITASRIKVWEERDTDHLWIQTAQQKRSSKTHGAGQLQAAFHTQTWSFSKVHPLRHTTTVLWHRILKTSKAQQGFTGLFKPYYPATEHWAILVPSAQSPYKIFQGNWILCLLGRGWAVFNISTVWKLWATLADRRAFPRDCTGQSCINAHKTPHFNTDTLRKLFSLGREKPVTVENNSVLC